MRAKNAARVKRRTQQDGARAQCNHACGGAGKNQNAKNRKQQRTAAKNAQVQKRNRAKNAKAKRKACVLSRRDRTRARKDKPAYNAMDKGKEVLRGGSAATAHAAYARRCARAQRARARDAVVVKRMVSLMKICSVIIVLDPNHMNARVCAARATRGVRNQAARVTQR